MGMRDAYKWNLVVITKLLWQCAQTAKDRLYWTRNLKARDTMLLRFAIGTSKWAQSPYGIYSTSSGYEFLGQQQIH